MRIELRFLHSPDLPGIGAGEVPSDPECFCLLVQAFVGEAGKNTPTIGESFDFLVCTPRWLEEEVNKVGYLLGLFHIIVPRYDYQRIRQIVAGLCEQSEGPDWTSVATNLGRFGQWEWDDSQRPTLQLKLGVKDS